MYTVFNQHYFPSGFLSIKLLSLTLEFVAFTECPAITHLAAFIFVLSMIQYEEKPTNKNYINQN